jgi:drug/metabolite transporter (DMT)-like permease
MRPTMSLTSRSWSVRPGWWPPGARATRPTLAVHPARLAVPAGAVAALIGANLVWGGSVVASQAALAHLPPLTLACLRVAVGWIVLRLLLARGGGAPASGRGPALLGLAGVSVFCAAQNLGLGTASAGTSALINGAIPVLTGFLAATCLGERLGLCRLAGLLVSLAGIATLVFQGAGITSAAALGNLLPLASAVSFAAYAVLGRRVFPGKNALAVVTGSTGYGFLFLLPGGLYELAIGGITTVTARDALLVLYLGAGCSALAFVLCGYGLARVEAARGAAFGNLKPLVGFALAVTLLGEPLTTAHLAGGALILLGTVIAGRSVRREG